MTDPTSTDPSSTDTDLRARIDALEAENARLRETATSDAAAAGTAASAPVSRVRRHRGRTVAAVALVLVGLLLAPVAVISAWARLQLVDTDRFVATFAPLAAEPEVQDFIGAQVSQAIEEQVDIPQLTADVFDGIESLDLPPRAIDALNLLEGPATQGLTALLERTIDRVVSSEAFQDVFASALRASHTQFVAALQGDPDAALAIGDDGTLSIQLGPIIEEVKQRLEDRGIDFASAIPVIDRTVAVAKVDSLALVQTVYTLSVAVGTWLPLFVLALLALGVIVAKRRSVALAWTAGGLALVMLLTLAGLGTGKLFFVGTVSPSIMPSGTAEVVYGQLTELMASTIAAITVLAIAVAIIAWLSGPWRPARALRGFADSAFGAARRSAEAHGVTTGRFGEGLHRYRIAAYVVIAVIAALVLMFNRPLETGLVVWTVVLALLAVGLVELLRRPPVETVDTVDTVDTVETAEGEPVVADGEAAEEALHRMDSARPAG